MCEGSVCEVIVFKFVCVKLVYVKLLYVKFVCVKFVCVKLLYVKAAGGGGREEAGIQNQKQEPHTKMWGKKTILKHFLKGILKGNLLPPKLRKFANKPISQPGCSHANTIYDFQLQKTIVLRMQPRHEATLTQPFQCNLPPQLQETHRTTHTGRTTRCKTHRRNNSRTKRPQPHPSHRRGTFHRRLQPLYTEKQGFVLRLPPQNVAHATFMQPLQCVSQHPVANLHLSTHVAMWQHQMTTMKQPFHCNLQPEIQEPHRTTHTDTTTRCKTHRRNNSRTKRPQPHPSHRQGTFHRRLQPLYTEKHKVSCSGFLPKT